MLYTSNKGNKQMGSKWTNLLDCFNKRFQEEGKQPTRLNKTKNTIFFFE